MGQPKLSGGSRLLMVNECGCGSSVPVAWLRRPARAAQRVQRSSDGRAYRLLAGRGVPEGALPEPCLRHAHRTRRDGRRTRRQPDGKETVWARPQAAIRPCAGRMHQTTTLTRPGQSARRAPTMTTEPRIPLGSGIINVTRVSGKKRVTSGKRASLVSTCVRGSMTDRGSVDRAGRAG